MQHAGVMLAGSPSTETGGNGAMGNDHVNGNGSGDGQAETNSRVFYI
jgi:hypothetical protein